MAGNELRQREVLIRGCRMVLQGPILNSGAGLTIWHSLQAPIDKLVAGIDLFPSVSGLLLNE